MQTLYSRIVITQVEQKGGDNFIVHVKCVAPARVNPSQIQNHGEPLGTIEDVPVSVKDGRAYLFSDRQQFANHAFSQDEIAKWADAHPGEFSVADFVRAQIAAAGPMAKG